MTSRVPVTLSCDSDTNTGNEDVDLKLNALIGRRMPEPAIVVDVLAGRRVEHQPNDRLHRDDEFVRDVDHYLKTLSDYVKW